MMTSEAILARLLDTPPLHLSALPSQPGIYALYDHAGQVRYIGVTEKGLKKRIAQYHVSGDDNSHKYSSIYNAGRMFHTKGGDLHSDSSDGRIAKELRRLFARACCRAVGIPLLGLDKVGLFAIETEVKRIAPATATSWNDLRALMRTNLLKLWMPSYTRYRGRKQRSRQLSDRRCAGIRSRWRTRAKEYSNLAPGLQKLS